MLSKKYIKEEIMANRNYYRIVLSNDFLRKDKEISAQTRYEFNRKVENQKRIWA